MVTNDVNVTQQVVPAGVARREVSGDPEPLFLQDLKGRELQFFRWAGSQNGWWVLSTVLPHAKANCLLVIWDFLTTARKNLLDQASKCSIRLVFEKAPWD